MNQDLLNQETDVNPIAVMEDLRSRVLAGEDVPAADYAKVIAQLRRARLASPPTGKRGATKKAAPVSTDLSDFD